MLVCGMLRFDYILVCLFDLLCGCGLNLLC